MFCTYKLKLQHCIDLFGDINMDNMKINRKGLDFGIMAKGTENMKKSFCQRRGERCGGKKAGGATYHMKYNHR